MTVIIDYGVGNLFSLASSLKSIGADVCVSSDEKIIAAADRLILPGVGAFGDAAEKLRQTGLDTLICEQVKAGKGLLGICLGMQLLFERSYEYGEYRGLGLLKGSVVAMEGRIPAELKIPHIGWNALRFTKKSPIFKYISDGEFMYFVHSYFADGCGDSISSYAEYGIPLTASVGKDNIFGCQFHPEKSGTAGLLILKAFCEL